MEGIRSVFSVGQSGACAPPTASSVAPNLPPTQDAGEVEEPSPSRPHTTTNKYACSPLWKSKHTQTQAWKLSEALTVNALGRGLGALVCHIPPSSPRPRTHGIGFLEREKGEGQGHRGSDGGTMGHEEEAWVPPLGGLWFTGQPHRGLTSCPTLTPWTSSEHTEQPRFCLSRHVSRSPSS